MKKKRLRIGIILFLIFGFYTQCFSQNCNPPTATLQVGYSQTANPNDCNPAGTSLCRPTGETYPNAYENQVWSSRIQIPSYCPHPDDPPNSIAGVEFRVNFDKTKLIVTNETGTPITQLVPGSAFPNVIINTVDNNNGYIHYAAYAMSGQSSPVEVVNFYFKAIASTSATTISFCTPQSSTCNNEVAIVADYPGRSIVPPQLTLTNLTIKINDTTPPAIPQWSEPATTPADGQITISWAPNTDPDIHRYRVYFKATDCGGPCSSNPPSPPAKSEFSALTYVTHPTTTYTHTGLTNDTVKYWYIITAIDTSGNGDDKINRSSSIVGDVPSGIKPPATPTGLTTSATYTAGNKKITVSWNRVTTRADGSSLPLSELAGYNVYRASAPLGGTCGSYTKLNSTPIPPQNPQPSTYTYEDTAVFNKTRYCYRVDAQDTGGRKSNPPAGPSNINFDDPAPPTPTGLAGVAGDRKVDLSWNAVTGVDDLAGYNLYRAALAGTTPPPDSDFVLVNTAAPITETTYSNTGLTNGITYWYKITAVDTAPGTPSESARSTAIRVKVPEETPPVVQTATPRSATRIDVLFNEKLHSSSANTAANYRICLSGQPNCSTPALTISSASLQSDGKTVRLTTASQEANKAYILEVRNVADQWGNPICGPVPPHPSHPCPNTVSFTGFAADTTPPVVASAESINATTVVVNFLDQTGLESGSAQTASNYIICPIQDEQSTTCLTPNLSVSSATCTGDCLQVTLTTSSQLNRWYRVRVVNVTDSSPAQNQIADNGTTNVANFQGTCTESIPPTVSSVSVVNATTIDVNFSEPVDATTANNKNNYTFTPPLNVTGAARQSSPNTHRVRLTTATQACGTNYTLNVQGVRDLCLNEMAPQNVTGIIGYDSCPPTVVSAHAGDRDTSTDDNQRVTVIFSEDVTPATANTAGNYSITIKGTSTTLSVSAAALQTTCPPPPSPTSPPCIPNRTVVLTTASQFKDREYTVRVVNVKDTIGNTIVNNGITNVADFVGTCGNDCVVPTLVSAVAVSGTVVELTFSEPVDQATANTVSNYSISPTLSISGAARQTDTTKVRLTTATQSNIPYTVTVTGVCDLRGNRIDPPGQQQTFVGWDSTPPTVLSALSTSNTKVIVTFSEPVDLTTSQTASNYTITPTLSVSSATRLAETNKVELTTAGQLNQTYQVRVRNVKDLNNNTIVDNGTTNVANFTGTCTESTPPQVVSATPTSATVINVLFNEDMDSASSNTISNYTFSPSLSISAAALQTDKRTVRLTTATQSCGTSYTLTVTGARDLCLNAVAPPHNTATFSGYDSCPPKVTGATGTGPESCEVIFDEPVTSATANVASNYTIRRISDNATLTVHSAALQADQKTVRLTTASQAINTMYRVTVSGVRDLNNNLIGTTHNTADFLSQVEDNTPPNISSITVVNATTLDVLFNENLDATSANTAGNYSISPSLSVSSAALQADQKTVRLTTATQSCGVNYTLSVINVKDLYNNPILPSNPRTAPFTGFDSCPPIVAEALSTSNTKVIVTFSEPVDATTANTASNYTITPTLSVSSATRLAETNKVELTTAGQLNQTYQVRVRNVKDLNNNTIVDNGTTNVANFAGTPSETIPPQVVSATPTSGTVVNILFNEDMDSASCNIAANYTISPSLSISAAALQTDKRTVRLTTATQSCGTSYTVTVTGVKDANLNTIGSTNNTANFIGWDSCPPTVVGASVPSNTKVVVAFSEQVGSGATTASNYTISVVEGGCSTLSVLSATLLSGNTQVELTTSVQGPCLYRVRVRNVKDLNNNTIVDNQTTNIADFMGECDDSASPGPPTITSVTAINATTIDVLFNEELNPTTANNKNNYTITPSLSITGAALQTDKKTVRLTTATQQGIQYTLSVLGVADKCLNAITTAQQRTFTGFDSTPPTVAGAQTQDGVGTKVIIVFSEPVDPTTSQTASNYTITISGTSTTLPVSSAVRLSETNKVELTTAQQSSVEYTVRVVNVKDLNNNTIVNNGTTNIARFQGAVPPKISTVTPASSTIINVLFDKLLDSTTANNHLNYTIAGLTISSAVLQGDNKTVRLTTTQQTCGASYTLSVLGVKDAYGNTITTPETRNFTGFDSCPPSILSLTVVNSTRVDVLFSEDMESASCNVAGNYSISPALSVSSAALQTDKRTVRLTTATQVCGTTYTLTISNVKDLANNVISPTGNTAQFTGYDSCPPTVSPQANRISSTEVEVTISEPVQPATIIASNFTITISGTTIPLEVQNAQLISNVPGDVKVKLTTAEQGPNEYRIRVRNIKDIQGNTIVDNNTTNVATFVGFCQDAVPGTPTIVSSTVVSGTQINILFNEDLDSTSANTTSNYVFSPSLSVLSAALQTDNKTVRLTTATQGCGVNYTISVTGVKDKCFNAIPSGSPQLTNFVGADTCGPTLLAAETTPGISDKVMLTFSEPVDLATSQVAGNYTITPALTVLSATRQQDTTKVELTTAPQLNQQYSVRVINVRDTLQNPILNNGITNVKTFQGEPPEKIPPSILTVEAPSKTTVIVTFSEEVEATSANTAANYTISGLTVSSAQRETDPTKVKLSTSRQITGVNYILEVRNVRDKYLNAIPSDIPATGSFAGSDFEDVTPPQIVSAFSRSKTTLEVNFDEEVDTASSQTAGNYTISPSLIVSSAQKQTPTRVLLTTSTQTDGASYTVSARNIKDLLGNVCSTAGCNGSASFVVPDYTPPRVSSATSTYSLSTNEWTVKVLFNEGVDRTTAETRTNYTISPTITVLSAQLDGEDLTDKTVILKTSPQTRGVSYTVTVTGVKDKSNNTISTNNTATFIGPDSTRPTYVASSISQTQVRVVFSEGVTTASATNVNNYRIENPSLTITNATISSDQMTVILTTSPQARIEYTLEVTNVVDLSGLLVATTGNIKTFTGKVDDPTPGAPYIVSATAKYISDNYYVDILFNELLDGNSTGNPANYVINNQLRVTSSELLPDNKTIRLATEAQVEKLQYTITVNNVEDIAGNKIATNSTVNFTGVDITPPKLISASSINSTTVDLVFDEAVSSSTANVAANYTIPGLTVFSAARQTDTKKVRLTTSTHICNPPTEYSVTVNNVTDLSDNVIDQENKTRTFVGFDSCPPQVVSAQTVSKTSVRVVFDETVELSSSQTLSNYVFTPSLTVTGAQRQQDTKVVILATTAQADNTTYTVAVRNVRDIIGNTCSTSGCNGSVQFTTGDYTPPIVVSAQGLYINDLFYVKVVFNEGLEPGSVISTSNYTITGGVVAQEAYLDPSDPDEKTVVIRTTPMIQGTSYTITVTNVKDRSQNVISGSNSANFTGPNTPPYIVSVSSDNQTTVRVEFSEQVTSTSANNKDNYYITPSLAIQSASLQPGNRIVLLTTANQQLINYTLVANNIVDLQGQTITTGNTKTFFGKVDAVVEGTTYVVSATPKFIDNNFYVDVLFSANMNPDTTENPDNYSINGLTISTIELLSDNKTARLLTSEQIEKQLYTLVVGNVTDATNKLLISTGRTAQFTGVDITPPKLVSASSINSTTVELTFDEEVSSATANVATNYTIPGLTVFSAARQTDTKKVRLTTSTHVCNPLTEYTVSISNVTDAAGNVVDPDNKTKAFFGFDSCPPTVLGAVSLSSTSVLITFSEPVDETTSQVATNYSITSPALTVSSAVRQSETNKVVITTSQQIKQTYQVRVRYVKDVNNNTIVDNGITNVANFAGTPSETIPPKVISAASTSASEINILFDEVLNPPSVTSVSNYTITPSGVTISSPTLLSDLKTVRLNVSGYVCGANYTVRVTGVKDANLNTIANVDNTANFTAWDNCPPTVVSATALSSTEVEVIFSEPVDLATSQTPSYYTFTPSLTVLGVVRSGDQRSVLITTSPQLNQNYTVRVDFVRDLFNNPISANNTAAFAGIPTDPTQPYVISATATSLTSVNVVFSKALNPATANTLSNYTITGLTISGASLQPDGVTVRLTTSTQTCDVSYEVRASNIRDTFLNLIDSSRASAVFSGWDNCRPTLVRAMAENAETVRVEFSEDVTKSSAETITNYAIPGLTILSAVQQPDTKVVLLSTSPQLGINYTLTVNGIYDLNNNVIPTNSQTTFLGISYYTEQPRVVSATPINATNVDIRFHKDMDSVSVNCGTQSTCATRYTISPTLPIFAAQLLGDRRTVRLVTSSQACGEMYKVTANNVKDVHQNVVDPLANEVDFIGFDSCPPTVLSAYTIGGEPQVVYIEFSEIVDPVSSQTAGNYTISGLTVNSALRLQDEPNKVKLTTTPHKLTQYSVRVRNVKDTNNNIIADTGTTNVKTFQGEPPEFEPPQILFAVALTNTTVEIRFKDVEDPFTGNIVPEELDRTSAIQATNYIITPSLTISSIEYLTNSVRLTTSSQTPLREYTVKVINVADKYLNVVSDDGTNIARFIGKCTDATPPTLAAGNPVSVRYISEPEPTWEINIAFNENLSATSVRNLNNYRITGPNSISINTPKLLPDKKTISLLSTSEQIENADYTLTISNIADECQNVITSPIIVTFKGADSTFPRIEKVEVIDHQTVQVTFSENLKNLERINTTVNKGDYIIEFADESGELEIISVTAVSQNVARITTREQQKINYRLTVWLSVTDMAGNPIFSEPGANKFIFDGGVWKKVSEIPPDVPEDKRREVDGNQWIFEGKSKDITPPTVKSIVYQKHQSNPDIGYIIIEFSEAMHNDTRLKSNYEILPQRTIYFDGVLSQDRLKVTLTVDKLLDGVEYTVKVKATGSVKDVGGNALVVDHTATIFVDNIPPRILFATSITNTKVEVVFSENIGQAGNFVISPPLSVQKTEVVENKVIVTTSPQTGGVLYTITATGTTDIAGNVIEQPGNSTTFTGRPQLIYPILESVISEDSTKVLVKFDSPVDKATAETSANYTIVSLYGTPLSVISCTLLSDKMTVRLTTGQQQDITYYLTAKNIKLEGGDTPSPQQQKSFRGTGGGIITNGPRVIEVNVPSQNKIEIVFDREMSRETVETVTNYSILGLTILSSKLQDDGKTLLLTTSSQRAIQYTLSISSNVRDRAGNPIEAISRNISFTGKDEEKPTIGNIKISPDAGQIGKDILIQVDVKDNTKVEKVELRYRVPGAEKTIKMVSTPLQDRYEGIIPASDVTIYDIEYYIVAMDSSGNVSRKPDLQSTYTIKTGIDNIKIVEKNEEVKVLSLRTGESVYLKLKCYLGNAEVDLSKIPNNNYTIVWESTNKKGSIVYVSANRSEIKYIANEGGNDIIKVTLRITEKGPLTSKVDVIIGGGGGGESYSLDDPAINNNINELIKISILKDGLQPPKEDQLPGGLIIPEGRITSYPIQSNTGDVFAKKPIENNKIYFAFLPPDMINNNQGKPYKDDIINREIRIYTMQGRLVKKLEVVGTRDTVEFNPNELPRGIYIYQGVATDTRGNVIKYDKPRIIRILR